MWVGGGDVGPVADGQVSGTIPGRSPRRAFADVQHVWDGYKRFGSSALLFVLRISRVHLLLIGSLSSNAD